MWIGRLCEEFHEVPSVMLDELERVPCGLLEEIVEARAYLSCKGLVDRATTPEQVKRLPKIPMIARVKEIEIDLVQETRGTNAPIDQRRR